MNHVIEFNHISNDLSEVEKNILVEIFYNYHFKNVCYRMSFRHFKIINIVLNIIAVGFIIGTIVGTITLNPIILGSVTGGGIMLQTALKLKTFERKIEMTKFAYTIYQKVLNQVRGYLRGEQYNYDNLIKEMNWLDDQVTDLCPPMTNKIKDKYNKKYLQSKF